MEDLKSYYRSNNGVFFVVATPIGNLQDITLRAKDILKNVDYILAEDIRVGQKLLQNIGINNKLQTYNDHSDAGTRRKIIDDLASGVNVALISDAGTPLISDPGFKLVDDCKESGLKVVPIPGASAVTAALCASGMPSDTFLFAGFFLKKSSAAVEMLASFAALETTVIFYESPNRIVKTLQTIASLYPELKLCVAREITKVYEEFINGTVEEVIDDLVQREKIRGEIVLLLDMRGVKNTKDGDVQKILEKYMEKYSMKDSVTLAAQELNMPKNMVYKLAMQLKK